MFNNKQKKQQKNILNIAQVANKVVNNLLLNVCLALTGSPTVSVSINWNFNDDEVAIEELATNWKYL